MLDLTKHFEDEPYEIDDCFVLAHFDPEKEPHKSLLKSLGEDLHKQGLKLMGSSVNANGGFADSTHSYSGDFYVVCEVLDWLGYKPDPPQLQKLVERWRWPRQDCVFHLSRVTQSSGSNRRLRLHFIMTNKPESFAKP